MFCNVVIVFGQPVGHEHENILGVLRNTSALIQTEHLPGMDYASVLLNQLFNMYKQVQTGIIRYKQV